MERYGALEREAERRFENRSPELTDTTPQEEETLKGLVNRIAWERGAGKELSYVSSSDDDEVEEGAGQVRNPFVPPSVVRQQLTAEEQRRSDLEARAQIDQWRKDVEGSCCW